MGIDSFKTKSSDSGNYRYTDSEIKNQLSDIADEYGTISSALINDRADFHYMTVSERYGDGYLKPALINLGFEEYANIKHDEYKPKEVLSYIRQFYNEYGYFTIREFNHNTYYPTRTVVENYFDSFEDAMSEAGVPINSHRGYKQRHEMIKMLALDELENYYDYYNCFSEVPVYQNDMSDQRVADILLTDIDDEMVSVVEVKATFSDYKRHIESQIDDLLKLDCKACIFTFRKIFDSFEEIKSIIKSKPSIDVIILSDVDIQTEGGKNYWATSIKDYQITKI